MANEHWTDRLSEYLDGELNAAERAACEAHLEECSDCAGTLEELRALVSGAALLPDVPPRRDLWPGIERRLPPRTGEAAAETGRTPARLGAAGSAAMGPVGSTAVEDDRVVSLASRRRVSVTVPQLAAAAIALILFSAGSVWLMLPISPPRAPQVATAPGSATRGAATATPVSFTTAYEEAVTDLEAEFEQRRADLDPATVRVVEENLAIIDRAIVEARRALEQDPSSGFLTSHLAGTMRKKVDLLRRVAALEQTEI